MVLLIKFKSPPVKAGSHIYPGGLKGSACSRLLQEGIPKLGANEENIIHIYLEGILKMSLKEFQMVYNMTSRILSLKGIQRVRINLEN